MTSPHGAPPLADVGAMFLVWAERHRGTRSAWLADALGIAELRYFAPTQRRRLAGAWRKYPVQAAASLGALLRRRPRVVFVQSPPSFATWMAAVYAAMSGAVYVIDAHSDAFEREIWTRPAWVTRLVARRATATIVTNAHWARRVESWGGRALIVPSIPTTFPSGGRAPDMSTSRNVAVVNTWARDEPLEAILDAARLAPEVTFHVTGRAHRVASLARPVPPNVRFTDFLPEEDYHALLREADAVMCLTTRDHTMQNGACEALSHGTPIITSDWAVLREYFDAGTVHTDATPARIAEQVRRILADLPRYRAEVEELRARRLAEWEVARADLVHLVRHRLAARTDGTHAQFPEEPS
jgi:glycosyltransferase involved in cell wall biosynthesis